MTASIKKTSSLFKKYYRPTVSPRINISIRFLKKLAQTPTNKVVKIFNRAMVITSECVGRKFDVHTGKKFITIIVNEQMVGHKFGEFAPTRIIPKHPDKKAK